MGFRNTNKARVLPEGRKPSGAVFFRFLALMVLLAFLPGLVQAGQDPSAAAVKADNSSAKINPPASKSPNGNQKIRVHVEVVNVPVSVLDKRGLPVIDLTKGDFKIFEDGKPQTIAYFSSERVPPLRVGLIIDTSNSARLELKFEKEAASSFVFNMLRGLHSGNQIFLQTFDATSSIIQDFTNDPNTLNEKIDALKAGGGKALYDAIYDACEQEMAKAGPREENRRVLVLISDGIDVESKHTLDEAISIAHRAETAIYAIGNTPFGYANPGDKFLEKIAEQTGGAAYFPLRETSGSDFQTGYLSHGKFDELDQNKGLGAQTGIYTANRMIALADSLDAIRRELANQYLIGYTPTDTKMDGTYRSIRVMADRKGITIRNKPGYFALPGE